MNIPARKRAENDCPEEDQNILVETLAGFSACFVGGIEEHLTLVCHVNCWPFSYSVAS